jgi:16S rRNA (cytosine967-C5)-methyltransferase
MRPPELFSRSNIFVVKNMSWHPPLVESVIQCLEIIFDENRYADKVIEKVFKQNRKLGSRDRKLIAESVYDIVRFIRRYSFIAGSDNWTDLFIVSLLSRGQTVPKFILDTNDVIDRFQKKKNFINKIAVTESYPDWIVEIFEDEFAEEAAPLLKSLNEKAEVFLRVNTLKSNVDEVITLLKNEEIIAEKVKDAPSALRLVERKNVFTTEIFKKGYFEVQDAASQFIAVLLDAKPGERVVDACAGAGGKTLHIASLMKNKGKVISMDIHQRKLDELRQRCRRNGVDIVESKLIESNKTIKRLENSFDAVLLDVPCSGLGVLRRNPDTKWKLSRTEIDRLVLLQQQILADYAGMAKNNGRMVYSTCSVLKRENEEQVQKFLNSEPGKKWTLQKEIRLWPHREGFDGFYAALLTKQN